MIFFVLIFLNACVGVQMESIDINSYVYYDYFDYEKNIGWYKTTVNPDTSSSSSSSHHQIQNVPITTRQFTDTTTSTDSTIWTSFSDITRPSVRNNDDITISLTSDRPSVENNDDIAISLTSTATSGRDKTSTIDFEQGEFITSQITSGIDRETDVTLQQYHTTSIPDHNIITSTSSTTAQSRSGTVQYSKSTSTTLQSDIFSTEGHTVSEKDVGITTRTVVPRTMSNIRYSPFETSSTTALTTQTSSLLDYFHSTTAFAGTPTQNFFKTRRPKIEDKKILAKKINSLSILIAVCLCVFFIGLAIAIGVIVLVFMCKKTRSVPTGQPVVAIDSRGETRRSSDIELGILQIYENDINYDLPPSSVQPSAFSNTENWSFDSLPTSFALSSPVENSLAQNLYTLNPEILHENNEDVDEAWVVRDRHTLDRERDFSPSFLSLPPPPPAPYSSTSTCAPPPSPPPPLPPFEFRVRFTFKKLFLKLSFFYKQSFFFIFNPDDIY